MSKKNILILILVILFAGIAIRFAYMSFFLWIEHEIYVQERPVYTLFCQVENKYRHRIDLIKAYAKCQQETTQADNQLVALVATADSIANIKIDHHDTRSLQQYTTAQEKLYKKACAEINKCEYIYPELKSDDILKNLHEQLLATEDCILIEQKLYNKEVNMYNSKINKFPFSLLRIKELPMWTIGSNDQYSS